MRANLNAHFHYLVRGSLLPAFPPPSLHPLSRELLCLFLTRGLGSLYFVHPLFPRVFL